jgi:hypothetical protein
MCARFELILPVPTGHTEMARVSQFEKLPGIRSLRLDLRFSRIFWVSGGVLGRGRVGIPFLCAAQKKSKNLSIEH